MFVFQGTVQESEHTPSSESGNKLQLQELHSPTQHQAALNFACEHLCVISIYFVHLLARCVPKVTAFFALCLLKVSYKCSTLKKWGKPVLYDLNYMWNLKKSNS